MTPEQIVNRAWIVWPLGTVPYDQATDHDCSAFVSDVLGIARQNTVTLLSGGFLRPLAVTERLQPGDFTGLLGPGTEGDIGHVQVVTAVQPDGYDVVEQRGGTVGPTTAHYAVIPAVFAAYRSTNLEDDMEQMVRDASNGAIYLSVNWATLHHLSGPRFEFLMSQGIPYRGDVDISLYGWVQSDTASGQPGGAGLPLSDDEINRIVTRFGERLKPAA